MSLQDFTTEELEKEIEKRKEIKATMPEFRSDVTSTEFYRDLENLAKDVVRNMSEDGCYDDDIQDYMFETVMELFYGSDYFKWHNAVLR